MSTRSRPRFESFEFNETALEAFVKSKHKGDQAQFETFLSDVTLKLTSLRRILFSIKWDKASHPSAVWAEKRVQCIMQLFLNDIFAAWFDQAGSMEATAANADKIKFSVNDNDDETEDWSGYSDLKCGPFGCDDIYDSTTTIEMKVPFMTSLWHSKGLPPRQQLLGQAIGLFQSARHPYRLSFLTDMFALSVMHYDGNVAYLSRRVTSAKEFCLRLLLACFHYALKEEDWNDLIAKRTTCAVDLSDENDVDEYACNAGKMEDNEKNVVACGTIGLEEDEAHESRLAEMSGLLRWQAKCQGVRFLGSEELQQHCL